MRTRIFCLAPASQCPTEAARALTAREASQKSARTAEARLVTNDAKVDIPKRD